MFLKVKEDPALVRDTRSNAIINTDVDAYNAFMKRRKMEEEHNQLVETVSKMEEDMGEIKQLLSLVLNKINS